MHKNNSFKKNILISCFLLIQNITHATENKADKTTINTTKLQEHKKASQKEERKKMRTFRSLLTLWTTQHISCQVQKDPAVFDKSLQEIISLASKHKDGIEILRILLTRINEAFDTISQSSPVLNASTQALIKANLVILSAITTNDLKNSSQTLRIALRNTFDRLYNLDKGQEHALSDSMATEKTDNDSIANAYFNILIHTSQALATTSQRHRTSLERFFNYMTSLFNKNWLQKTALPVLIKAQTILAIILLSYGDLQKRLSLSTTIFIRNLLSLFVSIDHEIIEKSVTHSQKLTAARAILNCPECDWNTSDSIENQFRQQKTRIETYQRAAIIKLESSDAWHENIRWARTVLLNQAGHSPQENHQENRPV